MQSNLNDKQKEAISLGLGPAMILAGPGSGKTTVLLYRIKYLIDELHISPKNILVITFTKAAAKEMKNRACGILNLSEERPFFGTFHSYFYSILKRSYEYRNYSILTTKQKRHNLERLLQKKYPQRHLSNHLIQDILAVFSKRKNFADYEKDVGNLNFSIEEFEELQTLYDHFNRENGLMDYDDILCLAWGILTKNSGLLKEIQGETEYILVDEFQDVNRSQYQLLTLLSEKCGNLFVVGDDDQSIYRFRGSDEEIFKLFERDFPSSHKVILDTNYRCPVNVVEISSKLIKNNENRFLKQLRSGKTDKGTVWFKNYISKEEERTCIIEQIKGLLAKGENCIAILCRTNSQLSYFAERLRKEKITFYMKEKTIKFYEGNFVKTIIGYLMFASKVDRSRKRLFTFLNQPVRYIKREFFGEYTEVDLRKIENECVQIKELIEILEHIGKMSPGMAIAYILKVVGFEQFVLGRCTSGEEISEFYKSMEELKQRGAMYSSVKEWMQYVKIEETLEEMEYITKETKDVKVFLYTFHGAKGLEFSNVIIPHLNEGSVPYGKNLGKEELEEERRMFYVALTRSSNFLLVTYVENDTKKDTVSRFIKETSFTVSK